MPSEPAESNFKSKVKAKAYPTRDINHMVWIYMGPREIPPPFPLHEITTLPEDQVLPPTIMMEEANWFQNLEGDIDSSHIDYLHSRLTPEVSDSLARGFFSRDRSPKLDVVLTDYGAFYSAQRKWDDEDNIWHRITQYIMPMHTMIAASSGDSVSLRSHVPLDDHYSMMISQRAFLHRAATPEERAEAANAFTDTGGYLPETSDPRTRYFTAANKSNDYKRDYELEKTRQFTGISLLRAGRPPSSSASGLASDQPSGPRHDGAHDERRGDRADLRPLQRAPGNDGRHGHHDPQDDDQGSEYTARARQAAGQCRQRGH